MDCVFSPDHRKWISPLTNLGESINGLKELVHRNHESMAMWNIGIKTDSNLEGPSYVGECPLESSTGHEESHLLFRCGNVNTDTASVKGVTGMLGEIRPLPQKLQLQDVWSEETDDACTAAVEFLGGSKFFEKEKKIANKRGKKKTEEVEDENEEEDFIDEPNSAGYELPADGDGTVDEKMYQEYNYGVPQEKLEIGEQDEEFDLDELNLMEISGFKPGAMVESDDDETFAFDMDEGNNRCNDAGVYDIHRPQQEETGYQTTDSEDNAPTIVSEDEENDEENVTDQQGMPSEHPDFEVPSTPYASLLAKLQRISSKKEKTKANVKTTDPLESNAKSMDPASSNFKKCDNTDESQNENEEQEHESEYDKEQSPITDFKEFTNWVFKQTKRKEKEQMLLYRSDLMKLCGMTEEEIIELQEKTSATHATIKNEVFRDEAVMKASSMPLLAPPLISPDVQPTLQSLAVFITHGEDPSCFPWKSVNVQQQINDDFANDQYVKRMKQMSMDLLNPAMQTEMVDFKNDFLIQMYIYQAIDPDDVLPDEVKLRRRVDDDHEVTVAINHLNKFKIRHLVLVGHEDNVGNFISGQSRYIEPKLAYELNLLGSQTVGDLAKAFHCENDYIYLEDIPHPEGFKEDPTKFAKHRFPSCMIMIDDTIYTDPNICDVDYASLINHWAERGPEKRIGPFKRGTFDTKLKDLDLRFGFPYVYVHFGTCEHIFVFTKIRLLNGEDFHLQKSYPKIIGIPKFKNIYCRVDNEYLARWAILDYKEFPENPMLLCTECVLDYCYDKCKKKKGAFKLYPFTQLANLL